MKKLLYILSLLTLVACQVDDVPTSVIPDDAQELHSVNISMSRAVGEVAELTDYVGRKEFSDKDIAVFTSIQRTEHPINQFTYENLQFRCAVQTTNNTTSVGWSRIQGTGTTKQAGAGAPDRIYWSDATSPHTFIGYCVPQQGGAKDFDWKKHTVAEHDIYYGSLGDPEVTGIIDYRSEYSGETETVPGNTKLCKDDILLTYSTTIKAEDAIARLRFHHGLAQVRVIVNISDFAAGHGADTTSIVSDMRLKEMLTMYKWNQVDSTTTCLVEADNAVLSANYSPAPAYDQRKDVMLWIPQPEGKGQSSNKTFTFYGLAVPAAITATKPLQFSFSVTYPNPMKPTEMQTKTYAASIKDIEFTSGKCTTINISLNHRNEKLTVGAQYDDWDYVESPNQGALKKNSTFLASTARSTVTILGDENATADDATWLYHNGTKVVDIYGNDGSPEKPFTISTAKQLLSFAYEVKGTERHNVTSTDGVTLADGGWNFQGKYVKLDADIHLQSVVDVDSITKNKEYLDKDGVQLLNWIGIGDKDHAFNGNFAGGGRNITHLYGKAFFSNIGGWAIVSEINLSDVVRVTDHGALAETNGGFLYACRVEGEVQSDRDWVGSLCGDNTGFIFACIHNGAVRGTKSGAKVGGLLGRNEGTLAVSYHTGAIVGTNTYGVEERAYTGSKTYACYYNSTLATPTATVDPDNIKGRTLGQMQSRSFAETDLNAKIKAIIDDTNHLHLFDGLNDFQKAYFLSIINKYQFVFTPGAYPRVQVK